MTEQENLQVAQYIAGLKAQHETAMQVFRAQCQTYFDATTAQHKDEMQNLHNKFNEASMTAHVKHEDDKRTVMSTFTAKLASEEHARKVAQQAELKVCRAITEIWNLAGTQSTMPPQQFAVCVRQIIDHYCPDCDVPY